MSEAEKGKGMMGRRRRRMMMLRRRRMVMGRRMRNAKCLYIGKIRRGNWGRPREVWLRQVGMARLLRPGSRLFMSSWKR